MEINKESLASMTPEQIVELAEKAQLADELKTKHEQAESEKANLVEELKEERKKKQLAEAALAVNNNGSQVVDEQKARDIVKAVLSEERSNQIETTRSEFDAKFKASNPEFNTSNDPGGIKYDAFKKTLSKFNLNGLTKESDFAEVYSAAMILLGKGQTQNNQGNNPYAFGQTSRGNITAASDNNISAKERKLIESIGWTEEKYLQQKAKRPEYIQSILAQVRD